MKICQTGVPNRGEHDSSCAPTNFFAKWVTKITDKVGNNPINSFFEFGGNVQFNKWAGGSLPGWCLKERIKGEFLHDRSAQILLHTPDLERGTANSDRSLTLPASEHEEISEDKKNT